jgi:hypothetical protein
MDDEAMNRLLENVEMCVTRVVDLMSATFNHPALLAEAEEIRELIDALRRSREEAFAC